jgi:hypothetical protein
MNGVCGCVGGWHMFEPCACATARYIDRSIARVGRPSISPRASIARPHLPRFSPFPSHITSHPPIRYNLGDLAKFSCTLFCLHEYVADVTAVRTLMHH